MDNITLRAIARVRNDITQPVDTGWGNVQSAIVLKPEWEGAFDGLDQFSHALILTYLHQVAAGHPKIPVRRHPRNRADMPLLGVLSQRARVRPNPIGVTACEIISADARELIVRGLDAIDGTPVLDVKPYVPLFDRIESPVVPPWVNELFTDYR
jgi:tRNA-Thr(GGU) m(6)t(6)A37 methyltransferase TsaA